MKKTLLYIFILLILILLGIAIYLYFFAPNLLPAPFNPAPSTPSTSGGFFSPFSREPVVRTGGQSTTSSGFIDSGNQLPAGAKLPRIRHVYENPISGFVASTTATSTLVRFMDRGIGHIYEVNLAHQGITKISNTTIARVYRSFWNNLGTLLIAQYIKDTSSEPVTVSLALKEQPVLATKKSTKTSTSSLVQVVIPEQQFKKLIVSYPPQNIEEFAVSPKGDRIFSLSRSTTGVTGSVWRFDDAPRSIAFQSALPFWNIEWPSEDIVTLTTKGSGQSAGFTYFLDLKKNTFEKVLGNVRGLTSVTSKDASKIFFSETLSGRIRSQVFSLRDGSLQDVIFNTLAEKCVWSSIRKTEIICAVPTNITFENGLLPEAWYQGKTSFVDQIWYLDTASGESHLLADLFKETGKLIDATNLVMDSKEHFLFFMNKDDLTLWSLDLNE